MKQVVAILLVAGLFTACKKSNTEPHSPEVSGFVKYGGDPAADGRGYYLLADSTHEILSLQNLPAEYKHADVNVRVALRFFDTGQTMTTEMLPGAIGPRIIVVQSIRKL